MDIGGRGWALLTAVLLLLISSCRCEPRLAKPGSTHPSFPLDAFAKPAYKVIFQDDQPVGNQTALEILKAGRTNDKTSQELSDLKSDSDAYKDGTNSKLPFKAYLHRTSPQLLHVCTLAEAKQSLAKKTLELDESAMDDYRTGILRRALALLAPLKSGCLFHTHDWFTYSFCHGDALRQFHALPSTLGGGKTPAMDPTQDSYVLGRWREEAETVQSTSAWRAEQETRTVSDSAEHEEAQVDTADDVESGQLARTLIDEEQAGTHLMELVHFSSIEDNRRPSANERTSATSGSNTIEGKGRYISQFWSDGTLCNINNEPRSTEVQFHCAKTPPVDRIALIKEVTTCSYVIVIETPRLCEVPALAQVEEEVEEIHCRPILSDEAIQQRYQEHVRDTHASLIEGAKQADQKTAQGNAADLEMPAVGAKTDEQLDTASLETQLYSMFEKLTNTKLSPGKSLVDEVEVVVGMDEEGNLILEPRGDRIGSSHDLKQDGDAFFDASEALTEGHDAKDDVALPAEKIAEVVQRIKDMGLLGSDGAIIKIIRGDEGDLASDQTDSAGQTDTDADAAPTQANAAGQQTQTGTGQPAQRGNLMARETESFAQRVDRLYRAQEEALKQREASNRQERKRGEKDEGRERQVHVEL
jgi:hypothetical protein